MSEHPDDFELKQYSFGLGPSEFIAMINNHVQECDVCLHKVLAIVRESMLSATAEN
jgi:hypothetical protein